MYVGINDKARKIVAAYVGDANGKARKIIKGYVGDENNKARLFYDSTTPGGGNSDDYPVLKADWFTGDRNAKKTYTTIEMVNSYAPTGSESNSWNADDNNSGRIKCYKVGSKLIIAGDGSGGIKAPTSLYDLFYYFENVTSINGLNLLDTSNVTSMRTMFCGCKSLTSIDVSNFDTSNVTDMYCMFSLCESLTSLDVSNFNTSNVTDMHGIFNYCESLTSLDLTNFNTSNATDMSDMFRHCESLTSLNLTSFNTSKVTTMDDMFFSCKSLTSLNLTSFDTSNVTSMHWMFYDSESLTSIKVTSGKWTTANADTEDMFYNCGTSSVTYV